MKTTLLTRLLTRLALSTAALALASGPVVVADAPAGFTETVTVANRELTVINLIGEVRVEPHSGSAFEIVVQAGGRDATRDALKVDVKEKNPDGPGARVAIVFPLDEHSTYVYPALGQGSKSTFNLDRRHRHGDGWLASLASFFSGWSGDITVRGSGSGAEMWADLVVRVPRGATLTVEHGAGELHARQVDGALSLSTRNGAIEVADCKGARLQAATGSGSITAQGIAVDTLELATGSGPIEATALRVGTAELATGSGPVELTLDANPGGAIEVATGSGGIQLALPEDASAHIEAATGSGGISVDGFAGAAVRRDSDHELEVQLGEGGARVELATGSGKISIRGRR